MRKTRDDIVAEARAIIAELPTADQAVVWDDIVSAAHPVYEAKFYRNAHQLGEFIRAHGRTPIAARNTEERLLSNFHRASQVAAKPNSRYGITMTGARRAFIDRVAPGWNNVKPKAGRFEHNLDRVRTFVNAHGRLPQQHAADPEERWLAHWLRDQRVYVKEHDTAHQESRRRAAALDEAIPDWRGPDLEHTWRQIFHRVLEFQRQHDRLPRKSSTSKEEQALGSWFSSQRLLARTNHPRLTIERRVYIAETLTGDPHAGTWAELMPVRA